MELKDPPRLLDPDGGARDFVREALDAGRADRPRADQLARLAQRLPMGATPPPTDPGAPPHGPGAPAAPIAAIPSALPGAILGAALGLAVIGLHALTTHREAPPAAPREAPAAILAAAPAKPASPERARLDEAIPTPKGAALRAPAATAIPASASAEPAPPAADPAPSSAPAAIAAAPGSSLDLAAGSSPGTFGAASPTVDSETDIQLLQRAQDALGSAPARALDLANRHAARFPGAALDQEREVLAIDALVRLGRLGEARARTAAFAAHFPASAHLHRLEALVPSTGIDSEVHKAPAEPAHTP